MKKTRNGMDVSRHQGRIEWQKVSGVEFAILRAGYGRYAGQKDSRFEENYVGAAAAGIPVGAYWYSYAVSAAEAKQEAEACITCLNGKKLPCGVWFDQEYEPGILALSNVQRTEIVLTFTAALAAAGYDCGLYASEDFLKTKLNRAALGNLRLWVAHYGAACGIAEAAIWQYSSRGSVPGISGAVDLDVMYILDEPALEKPEEQESAAESSSLQSIKILEMSRGDFVTLTKQAESLGLRWEVSL